MKGAIIIGRNSNHIEAEICGLQEDLKKQYAKYRVKADFSGKKLKSGIYVFEIETKGSTQETHIRKYAPDVQRKLKLSMFQVVKQNFTLSLIVSKKKIEYDHLPKVLKSKRYKKNSKQMALPYVIGHNALGKLVVADISKFPHLLLGGATNSGKSVNLQALITSVAHSRSPAKVNFILIDTGVRSLWPFEGLLHLACPIIHDRMTAMYALEAVSSEMERRINLEYTDQNSYDQLPRLVLVIDEFPTLFTGVEKDMAKSMQNMLSDLLQRGRHAKIHLVLAAQNPSFQNLKVDHANITVRGAFKCAKKNNSETILGEGGAEHLLGQGDMLIKLPEHDELQRVQGIYINPEELQEAVNQTKNTYRSEGQAQKFVIPDSILAPANMADGSYASLHQPCASRIKSTDQVYANALLWTLGQKSISINRLQNEYHLGWNKAKQIVEWMEKLGILEGVDSKLSRHVLPTEIDEFPEEMLDFLQNNGISNDDINRALTARNGSQPIS